MKKYKIREYHKIGYEKGNLKKETFFDTLDEAVEYYREAFNYNDFSLNPTIWAYKENKWKRLICW